MARTARAAFGLSPVARSGPRQEHGEILERHLTVAARARAAERVLLDQAEPGDHPVEAVAVAGTAVAGVIEAEDHLEFEHRTLGHALGLPWADPVVWALPAIRSI
jgi:hypothetical protein